MTDFTREYVEGVELDVKNRILEIKGIDNAGDRLGLYIQLQETVEEICAGVAKPMPEPVHARGIRGAFHKTAAKIHGTFLSERFGKARQTRKLRKRVGKLKNTVTDLSAQAEKDVVKSQKM